MENNSIKEYSKQVVDFQVAKVLKEQENYSRKTQLWYDSDRMISWGGHFSNNNQFPNFYSAPTIMEVVDYLDEKYGIHIHVKKKEKHKYVAYVSYSDLDLQSVDIKLAAKSDMYSAYNSAILVSLHQVKRMIFES